jgi:NAD(P)-dependent dehydrogenase (short-subunit alcohol dehydrogenase family)
MNCDVAVVTGGGRGIGRAFAHRLAATGRQVLITDVEAPSAQAAAEELGCAWIQQDVRDVDSHRVVAERAAELGTLRIWINNAGVLIAGESWTHDPGEIARSFEVNVGGVIAGSHAAVLAMSPRGGAILNIASTAGLAPVPGLAVYAATKAAVLSFTTSLQGDLDHARLPIRARALCPDVTATDMVGDVAADPGAAILFAGSRQADANDVARAGLSLLESRQVMRAFPRSAGAIARGSGFLPSVGLRLSASAREAGARRQRAESPQA